MRGEILTPVEELLVVDALVKNIERHPDEWTFDNYYGSRATPLLKVWLANGVQWTRMETDHGNFGLRTVSQRRVFDALHKCRHEMQADFIKPLVNALAPPHEETVAKLAEIIKPKQLPAPQLVEAV